MKLKLSKAYLAVSVLCIGMAQGAKAETSEVEIDLSSQHYIGDTSQLQRNKFFNMHNTGGTSSEPEIDQLFIQNELNAGYGRGFWGPMAAAGSNSNYPDTEKALTDGPTSVANTKADPLYKFYSNRTILTEHPRNVIVDGNDPFEGARWAADYFEHYFDEETRPIFYEPMNEPFVHASDFVDGPWDPVTNAAMQVHMANWFKEIGQEFDNRGLKTNVIGFSSAWPSFELNDFDNWNTRMKMFMDVAGEQMDALSFHLYDGVNVKGQDNFRSGSNAEAIIDLVETYSHIKWGEIKPHALTEYGGIVDGYPVEYSPEKSSQELRSYNHLLFSFLERENRILTTIPFITGKAKWFYEANNFQPYSATVFRPDPDAIVAGKVNNFLPTEKAKFYYLWADVKGHRVAINTPDPDLGTQAFVYGNKAYIALNNYEDNSKDVTLDFVSQPLQATSVRIKRLDVPYKEAAKYTDEVVAQAPSSMTLAAHETVIIEYTYAAPLSHDSIARTRNYYADNYLEPIIENSSIQFTFDAVEVQQDSLNFTDTLAAEFAYDQAVVDNIGNSNTQRYESVLRSYEKQFEKIVSRYPHTWQQTSDYQKLVARALRSNTTKTALNYHYSLHGYNDSDNMAMLKMSIARKHDKSKQPLVVVNGHAVTVPNDWKGYDQITRSDFFGSIEIPVPAKLLKNSNTVDLTFPDTQGHVSSLILEVDTQEAYQHIAATGISLSETQVAINKDKPYRINAQVWPANASNHFVQWVSSAPDVATVDNHGLITPVGFGTSVLTATTYDGQFTETVSLEVKDKMTIRNTVAVKTDILKMAPSDTISIDVVYSSDTERDVSFELHSPTNQWLGSTQVTVPAGSNDATLTLNFPEELPPGKGYRLTASLKAVDGNWPTSVDTHVIKGIEITSPFTPPEPEEGNLLGANGGFEFGHLNDWKLSWDVLGSVEVLEEAAKDGQSGLKIDTTDGRVGILIDEDVLPQGLMKLGKKFKLSFYMKRLSGTAWAGGFAQLTNNNGGFKASTQGPWHGAGLAPTDWILIEKEIDGLDWPDTGTVIQINMQTPGNVWYIDNIKLEDISPVVVEPNTNILANVNPSFEEATIAPWAGYWENDASTNMVLTTDAASDKDQGLHLTSDGNKNTGINLAPDVAPQDLGLGEGKDYTIRFDIKSNNGKATGYIRNVVQGAWGSRIESWFDVNDSWKTVTITRTQQDWTELADNARLDLYLFANDGAGIDVYIDNIVIEPL